MDPQVADAGDAGGEVSIIAPPIESADVGAREAGRILAEHRQKLRQQQEQPAAAEAETPAAAEESPAREDAAAPQDEAPGETEAKAAEPEPEVPPIEPPRSWTKEQKERWASLPRETQEYVAQRETEREREIRRGQNEAAESKKSLETEKAAVAKARQEYEAALPLLLQSLQTVSAGEFADIKTVEDVQKLANEDWPKYIRWDAHQKRLAAVQQEIRAGQERQTAEYRKQWSDFAEAQDAEFIKQAPEFADKAKAAKLRDAAIEVLQDRGFTERELAELYNGEKTLSLRDHRIQLLILDGVKYRESQNAIAAAAKKAKVAAVPPVVRPGVAGSHASSDETRIKTLADRLDTTGSAKDAAALLRARRAARQ